MWEIRASGGTMHWSSWLPPFCHFDRITLLRFAMYRSSTRTP